MAAKRKEESRAFIDKKQADEAALQEQRRADCLRIDAEACALLQQRKICFRCSQAEPHEPSRCWAACRGTDKKQEKDSDSTTLATYNAGGLPRGADEGPGSEAFVAELKELTGVDFRPLYRDCRSRGSGGANVEVRRSPAYWTQAHALLEADGCMRPTQFDYHLREQMQSKLWWLCFNKQVP